MADQTFEHNNGRPDHNTGEIGDFLNSLPDREYWAARGMWYQKPESQDTTFEEHVREADAERREQARYDEENDTRRVTNPAVRPQTETQLARSESPGSVASDDSLYRNPSPRRGDRAESSDNPAQRIVDEGPDEDSRQTERSTIHAVMPGGFETDALDDEGLARLLANPPPELAHLATASRGPDPHHGDALDDEGLARLLANPPPEMLKQGIRTPVPGALDDDALESLLAKQREDIYEGGWRDLLGGNTSSADHLSDEDLEQFLANERERVSSGETGVFPAVHQHPDALDDKDLAKVIARLGFEQRPLMYGERGQSSRSRPVNPQIRNRSSGYGVSQSSQYAPEASRPAPPTLRMPPSLASDPNAGNGPSQMLETPLSPVRPDGSPQSFNDQLADRRRRMDERKRRQEEAAELERIMEELGAAAAVKEGKQPERYYE